VCDDGVRVPTPVGRTCLLCVEPVEEGDRGSFFADGAPAHRECALRSVLGGYGHLTNHTLWCVQRNDPDGGLSYRESAMRVWAMSMD
jgi:hypothetical protein